MRRKVILAASFVVTTAACNRNADQDTIHANLPSQPAPMPSATSTAPSTPTSSPNDPTANVTIEQLTDGKCIRVVHAACPPGVMCNPPPPKAVPCPDAGTTVTSTPKIDPTPDYIKNCPPGAQCNPPPPGM